MYNVYKQRPSNTDIFVYDESLTQVGLISEYESFIIERSHFSIGQFTLTVPETAVDADKLEDGRIITLGQSDCRAGIVRSIEANESRDEKIITIQGYMLKGLTRLRIIVPPTLTEDPEALGWDRTSGTAEEVYRHYIEKHITNPTDANRKIPLVVLDDLADPPRGIETPWQCQHDETLPDVLEEIGEWTDVGWDIRLDITNKKMVFVVIPGRDKTLDNTEGNSPVLFAYEMDNITVSRYLEDKSEYTNSLYIGGAGEDENQLVLTAYVDEAGAQLDTPLSGWERRESWISAGNIDDPQNLIYEGLHKYSDSRKLIQGLEGQVTPFGSFVYSVDWDVGDKVTLIVNVLGTRKRLDSRITLVREIYERSSAAIEVTVGSSELTVKDRLKELGKRK